MNQPARKSRLYQKRNPRPKLRLGKVITAGVLILLLFFVGFLILGPHIWDGNARISIAVQKKSGDVAIITADPQAGSITTIEIPGSTQVSASRNLGIWKLSTISKLGENEKIDGGSFLASTITKSFRFPIEAWADEEMLNLGFTNIFKSSSTNLHLKDKIALAFFSLRVKATSRIDLKLAATSYLTAARLPDGSNGYDIAQNIPIKVSSIFTDTRFSRRNINVVIIDKMPDSFITSRVGEIIEVLGGKIATVERLDPDTSDCVVKGRDEAVHKIAKLFQCQIKEENLTEKENIEILLGGSFKKRF